MKLEYARRLSSEITRKLQPYCRKFLISGDIRRGVEEPTQIQIVCVPKTTLTGKRDATLCRLINQWELVKGSTQTSAYIQRMIKLTPDEYPGIENRQIPVKILFVQENNFGYWSIATSSSIDFVNSLDTLLKKHGYAVINSFLYRGQRIIPVTEEKDVFELAEIPFIEPELRTPESISKYL